METGLSSLLLALGIFSIGFISIGPNILAIIGTSMDRGRHYGVRLALGVGVGSGIWATLTAIGLTALITTYAGVVLFLKIFGALYLIWLAIKSFRSAASPGSLHKPDLGSQRNLFLQGVAIQLSNPKAALHWVAIVGIGLGNEAPLWVGIALVVSATILSVLVHVLYAITFSTAPIVAAYQKTRRWVDGFLGLFFTFAAYKIATYRP